MAWNRFLLYYSWKVLTKSDQTLRGGGWCVSRFCSRLHSPHSEKPVLTCAQKIDMRGGWLTVNAAAAAAPFSALLAAALCLIFLILVSLENVKKYSHVVARLPQRLKSTLFEIFSTLRVPFGHPPFEKISNNVDFSLWGKQCICPAKMRPKLWKSHIVLPSLYFLLLFFFYLTGTIVFPISNWVTYQTTWWNSPKISMVHDSSSRS